MSGGAVAVLGAIEDIEVTGTRVGTPEMDGCRADREGVIAWPSGKEGIFSES